MCTQTPPDAGEWKSWLIGVGAGRLWYFKCVCCRGLHAKVHDLTVGNEAPTLVAHNEAPAVAFAGAEDAEGLEHGADNLALVPADAKDLPLAQLVPVDPPPEAPEPRRKALGGKKAMSSNKLPPGIDDIHEFIAKSRHGVYRRLPQDADQDKVPYWCEVCKQRILMQKTNLLTFLVLHEKKKNHDGIRGMPDQAEELAPGLADPGYVTCYGIPLAMPSKLTDLLPLLTDRLPGFIRLGCPCLKPWMASKTQC